MIGDVVPSLRSMPARHGEPRAGFGLIEAIVALAIAGLVLAAVTELAGRTLRSWNGGFATVAAVERTDIAIGRLGADLASLLPISLITADDPAILFAGDEKAMSFMALTPFDRTGDGIAVVEIAIETAGDGVALVRRLRRGRDAGLRDGDRVVLSSGRYDLAFAYRDRAGRRVERWTRPGEVPHGVIVTLKGDRASGGLPAEVLLPIPVDVAISCLITPSSDDESGGSTTNTDMVVAPRGQPAGSPGGPESVPQAEPAQPAGAGADRSRCVGAPGAVKNGGQGTPGSGEGSQQ